MDRRDFPNLEPSGTDEPATNPGRRFARLVESPAARKVARPRLLVAGLLIITFVALIGLGVTRSLRSAGGWVEQRPEYQLQVGRIELDPPPDRWIKGGADLILEGAKLGETISLLGLDLKGLEQDFRRSPWVKDVLRVDRSNYGRLIVTLVYRKPVAILEYGPTNYPYVLDEEAVVLGDRDIEWASWKDPYRPLGMEAQLIKIKRISDPLVGPKVGLPIKRKGEGDSLDLPDPLVQGGARLARFLLDRDQSSGTGSPTVGFKSIYLPVELDLSYFLLDLDDNWISWGRAPGDERPGKPSTAARWTMLTDWLKRHGPLAAKAPNYLYFETTGARLRHPTHLRSK